MNRKTEIAAFIAIILAQIVLVVLVPGGTAGMIVLFAGIIVVPGYLMIRTISEDRCDSFEVYPMALVVGFSMFGLIGMAMFFAQSPIYLAIIAPLLLAIVLFGLNLKENHQPSIEESREGGAAMWIFIVVLVATIIVAFMLGSFRWWYMEEDYYTYITMARRIFVRGFAGNFPLSYSDEGNDPIHSYNVWILMWAAIGKSVALDPIALYVKAGLLTIPAVALAFYVLAKTLIGRTAGFVAASCYMIYHFAATGFVIAGKSSFYNEDPAVLIFLPVVASFGWRWIERGGRGRLALTLLSLAGIMMVHPLWGGMATMALGLGVIAKSFASNRESSETDRYSVYAAWALIVLPILWAASKVLTGFKLTGSTNNPNLIGLAIFLILPFLLFIPRIVGVIKSKEAESKKLIAFVVATILILVPFAVVRFMETRGARSDTYEVLHPFKWFVSDRLFILHPFLYTFTEAGMTFWPWILVGVAALPFLIVRARKGDATAYFIAACSLAVPIIALNPYFAFLFCKILHPAYLRRALRMSAMFAAVGAGWGIWNLALYVEKAAVTKIRSARGFAPVIALVMGVVAAALAAVYPINPPYMRNAAAKALFVMTDAPPSGLFWSPKIDADVLGGPWDTEEFSKLLNVVPEGETILSDMFTSYRLTAYRDVYVLARPKPSFAVVDQKARDEDYARFVDASDAATVCDVMRKRNIRWLLYNSDPEYNLRGMRLWRPQLIQMLAQSREYFETAGTNGQWGLLKAKNNCSGEGK